jgi:hypothetical protein
LTKGDLKDVGKTPSARERLIRVVIGARRESRQDLMSLVGMGSRGHVEFEDARMIRRTSSCDAGERSRSEGGGNGGGGCSTSIGNEAGEGRTEQSLVILSLKNLRKEAARVDEEVELGSVGGGFRERRLSNADQSLRG